MGRTHPILANRRYPFFSLRPGSRSALCCLDPVLLKMVNLNKFKKSSSHLEGLVPQSRDMEVTLFLGREVSIGTSNVKKIG